MQHRVTRPALQIHAWMKRFDLNRSGALEREELFGEDDDDAEPPSLAAMQHEVIGLTATPYLPRAAPSAAAPSAASLNRCAPARRSPPPAR